MNIFRRNRNSEPAISQVIESTDPVDTAPEAKTEKEYDFENAHEAGKYVLDLLAEKDAILEDFYKQGKSHGMSDAEISLAAHDAIKVGELPAIAERAIPLRDGMRPIYLIRSLPKELINTVSVVMREDLKQVWVRGANRSRADRERLESGELAVLTPGHSAQPALLLNTPSDWQHVIGGLESEIRRPF